MWPHGALVDRYCLCPHAAVSCTLVPHNETVAADVPLAINEAPRGVWQPDLLGVPTFHWCPEVRTMDVPSLGPL